MQMETFFLTFALKTEINVAIPPYFNENNTDIERFYFCKFYKHPLPHTHTHTLTAYPLVYFTTTAAVNRNVVLRSLQLKMCQQQTVYCKIMQSKMCAYKIRKNKNIKK